MKLTQVFTILASPFLLSVLAAPQGSTYDDALQHIKADHPGISDADASTAAWGYIEALANIEFDKAAPTGLTARNDLEARGLKSCCKGCADGNCIIAAFLLGFCCIGG
ncbi:hypothetical protein QBC39DRAFT_384105 [Podospora conica]|nr:hypothetical protein QBC39DRAFT_384105 [Schizothecium conicum]